jgi:hypothetical protein
MIGLPEVLVVLISLVVLAPASLVYFFPTIVAFRRHVARVWWIAGLNVVLGCTVVGWVAALVWACKAEAMANGRVEPEVPARSR